MRHQRNRKRLAKRAQVRNGCAGKKRYDDDVDALWAAVCALRRSGRRIRQVAVYICDLGPHYHLTSRPGRAAVYVVEELSPAGEAAA